MHIFCQPRRYKMGSEWVDEMAILRDLALVQGCVPTSLVGTLAAGERPHSPRILEVTEEEYFKDCVLPDELGEPDYGLITHMLDVINSEEESTHSTPKPRKQRNAAVQSLLEMQRNDRESSKNDNFIIKKTMESYIGVYKGDVERTPSEHCSKNTDRTKTAQTKISSQRRPPALEFNPSKMFVRKRF